MANDFIYTDDFSISLTSFPEQGEMETASDGSFRYIRPVIFDHTLSESFTYMVCYDKCPDACKEATVTIEALENSPCNEDLPNAFTPNQDGDNDTFIIPCLYQYPGSSITICNRYGDEVYSCLLYTSPSPRDATLSRMPSSA